MKSVRQRLSAARRRLLGLEGLDPHLAAIEARLSDVGARLELVEGHLSDNPAGVAPAAPGNETAGGDGADSEIPRDTGCSHRSPPGSNVERRARNRWTEVEVVDAGHAAFALRTYWEQSDVRRYLAQVAGEIPVEAACDIGSGYGRMSVVLQETCQRVVAFEREAALCEQGSRLLPTVEFRNVETLAELPSPPAAFDVGLSFTVLQHLIDVVMIEAIQEIKRVVRRPGFVLLCEETDEGHIAGDIDDPDGVCTIGRSVEKYRRAMAPFELIDTSPRHIEPTYERSDVGTYMLFRCA
jgi:SAM-dependent methyltransferase